MASREERLQQRMRGANTRHVADVDFGLVFAPVAPSASPTPPSETQPTPQSLPAQLSTTRIPRNIHPPAGNESSSTPIAQRQPIHNANTSAKLRKLDTDPPLSSRSTRSARRTPRHDIHALVDESLATDSQVKSTDVSIIVPLTESAVEETVLPNALSERQATPIRAVEEVTESPLNAPGSGRRTRTVEKVASTSSRLQNVLEGSVEEEKTSPVQQKKRKRKAPVLREISPDLSQEIAQAAHEVDNLPSEQPIRDAKRRKAIVDPLPEPDFEEEEQAEEFDDQQAAIALQKNRRRSSRIAPTPRSITSTPDKTVSPVVPKKRKVRPRVSLSPVQQRQPKTIAKAQTQPKSKPKKQPSNQNQKRLGTPIPVVVHRLTEGVIYDDGEHDADVLNAPIVRPKQGGPNVIDVLSQVCQESVNFTLERYEELGTTTEDALFRKELKNKWDAIEMFGRELETRLLEHTINLDNGDSLQRRLRDEQKRKLDLREQICRIRAEREQVALNMDKVRIDHENKTAKALSRDSLNSAIQDIELAIDLGKSSHDDNNSKMVGTELLLKRIAGQVSNKSDSGGLLRQLKQANAFLERAALVLEGRSI